MRVTKPAVGVILVRRRVDTAVLADALRAGMREVVEERDLAGANEAAARALRPCTALRKRRRRQPGPTKRGTL